MCHARDIQDLVNDLLCMPFVRASSKRALHPPPPPVVQPHRQLRQRPLRTATQAGPSRYIALEIPSSPPAVTPPSPRHHLQTPSGWHRKHAQASVGKHPASKGLAPTVPPRAALWLCRSHPPAPRETLRTHPHSRRRALTKPKGSMPRQTVGRDTLLARPGAHRADKLSPAKRVESAGYFQQASSSTSAEQGFRRSQSEQALGGPEMRNVLFKAAAHVLIFALPKTSTRSFHDITDADVALLKWEHRQRLNVQAARHRQLGYHATERQDPSPAPSPPQRRSRSSDSSEARPGQQDAFDTLALGRSSSDLLRISSNDWSTIPSVDLSDFRDPTARCRASEEDAADTLAGSFYRMKRERKQSGLAHLLHARRGGALGAEGQWLVRAVDQSG